jgi:hypothetical protein
MELACRAALDGGGAPRAVAVHDAEVTAIRRDRDAEAREEDLVAVHGGVREVDHAPAIDVRDEDLGIGENAIEAGDCFEDDLAPVRRPRVAAVARIVVGRPERDLGLARAVRVHD